jgi:membrane associated rhomboid family serine protease
MRISSPVFRSFRFPLLLAALMAAIHLAFSLLRLDPALGGLYPRSLPGLWRIATAPLLHGSWEHLLSNLPPLIVLGAALHHFYRKISPQVWISAWLGTGLWVWAFARSSYHIGASGLVYGLAFFIFFSGVFRKDLPSITLALIVALLYGGMVWGILPAEPGISWESHLLGAANGVLLAWYFRKQGAPPPSYPWQSEPDSEPADEQAPWNYRSIPPPEGWQHR